MASPIDIKPEHVRRMIEITAGVLAAYALREVFEESYGNRETESGIPENSGENCESREAGRDVPARVRKVVEAM